MRKAWSVVGAVAALSAIIAAPAAGSPVAPVRVPRADGQVVVLAEQPYGLEPGPAHTFNAYLPTPGTGVHPGVILIHGGGWRHGSKRDMAFFGRYLARRGIAAFSINYRLAPRHRWPAQLEDAQMAVAWIRSQADTYGVDPTRLGAFGLSAGGHLAAMLSTMTNGDVATGSGIKVAAAWSAPMDLVLMSDLSDPNNAKVERFLGCDSEAECEQMAKQASPVTYVDRSDPPLYFVHSRHESRVPVAVAREMDRTMTKAHASHTYVELPGDKHAKGYKNDRVPGTSKSVLEATFDFFVRYL